MDRSTGGLKMATRKQRERMRQQRIAFDAEVEQNRRRKEVDEIFGNMTKAQLIQYAEDNNIEIDKKAKKEELLDAIKTKVMA